jgi:hypothetical protein
MIAVPRGAWRAWLGVGVFDYRLDLAEVAAGRLRASVLWHFSIRF